MDYQHRYMPLIDIEGTLKMGLVKHIITLTSFI